MDDLKFPSFFKNFSEKLIDIIFIDTSHLYDHTLKEIQEFIPLLNDKGIMIFHDSNICPIDQGRIAAYERINNTFSKVDAKHLRGNVSSAIKNYFNLSFNESHYNNKQFIFKNKKWQLIHYPFCNGLTLIKKN